ncbi:MAG: sodium/solute symporter [Gemmataceae bacterium]
MTGQLSSLDLAIVAVYIVGTTALGAWFTRGQSDVRTYFVGDRNVAWWLVLISIVATETSTVTFLSIPGKGYDNGDLTFLQLTFGYVIGRAVVAWLLLPQYLRGELFSAYQLLRERFDVRVQRTASALFLITRTVADGLRLWLTGLLLQQFTGWGIATAILVLGGVTIVYTYLGGMEAVIWTDLVQFVIYVSGAVIAAWFILHLLPGGWNEFVTVTERAGRFRVIDLDPSLLKAQTLWAGVFGGAFVTMASHGADQNMVQRYLCARSLGEARTALVLSGVLVAVQFTLFLGIGLGLSALKNAGVFEVPAGLHNDAVFGRFIVNYLPTGLVGLVVAAVLASAMASFSSSLNSAANAVVGFLSATATTSLGGTVPSHCESDDERGWYRQGKRCASVHSLDDEGWQGLCWCAERRRSGARSGVSHPRTHSRALCPRQSSTARLFHSGPDRTHCGVRYLWRPVVDVCDRASYGCLALACPSRYFDDRTRCLDRQCTRTCTCSSITY